MSTVFPDQIQYFQEKQDVSFRHKEDLLRIQTLRTKENLTPSEQDELNILSQKLITVLISAMDFNTLTDTMVAIQIAIKNRITELDLAWEETVQAYNLLEQEILSVLDAEKIAWNTWFAMINVDIQQYATFDFDNLAALPGVERLTVFSEGKRLQTITIVGSGAMVAERELDYDTFITTEKLYNGDGEIIRQVSIQKTFENGTIKDVIA